MTTPGRAWRDRWRRGARLGSKRITRWPVRCTACDQRRTLTQHPDEYVRAPRCRSGCRIRDERGRVIGYAPLRVDWWRIAKEWGAKPCYHCGGYSFPHARGRGWCVHNPRLTAEALQERAESGRWA
jgi:hypothetical protein